MFLVIGCWLLALVSAMVWAPRYTAGLIAVTLGVFAWQRGALLGDWTGWLQLATLGLAPWLLAIQRARSREFLRVLHAQEAERLSKLSESARALLSIQTSTQQMERQIGEITDLYHVTKETARALRVPELFTASLSIAPRLLNAKGLRLIDLSSPTPQVLRAVRTPDGRMTGSAAQPLLEPEETIMKDAMSVGRSGNTTVNELACSLPGGISRLAWATLWREQQPIGVLIADELPGSQLKTLSIVANQLSLQCSRISLYQQVEELAVTDALTGLFVRRHFLERAVEELSRSKRHGLSCTLLMADLDHFKQKNDTYGHLVGDVVLRDVARLLSRNLRDIDLMARYGGEEFVLLLIETPLEHALPIAQRLKQLVEVHPIRAYDELLTQTVSIGMAAFPAHGDTIEALIERADQALYEAKRTGRNQVVQWAPSMSR